MRPKGGFNVATNTAIQPAASRSPRRSDQHRRRGCRRGTEALRFIPPLLAVRAHVEQLMGDGCAESQFGSRLQRQGVTPHLAKSGARARGRWGTSAHQYVFLQLRSLRHSHEEAHINRARGGGGGTREGALTQRRGPTYMNISAYLETCTPTADPPHFQSNPQPNSEH